MSKQLTFDFVEEVEDEVANTGINAYGGRPGSNEIDLNGYMKIKATELGEGDTYEGVPDITLFFNDGKLSKKGKPLNFDNLRLRLWDKSSHEILDIYANIPKVNGGIIKAPLRKGDKFFRNGFDLIYSFYKLAGAPVTEKTNKLTKVDLLQVIDYINEEIDSMEIEVTNGHPQDRENSVEIIKME